MVGTVIGIVIAGAMVLLWGCLKAASDADDEMGYD